MTKQLLVSEMQAKTSNNIFKINVFQGSFAQPPISHDFEGLIGTKPEEAQGALWDDFQTKWNSLNPVQYPGANTTLDVSHYSRKSQKTRIYNHFLTIP